MDAASQASQYLESFWALLGTQVGPYVPRVLGAVAIALAAWIGAWLARRACVRLAARVRLEDRLKSPGLAETLAGVASALVWLLALPALLGTLELQGLLTPVNAMLSRLLGFVPNLIGALVVLAIGLLVARIARQVVSGLLRAAGSERLAEKIGLAGSLGADGLAGVAGQAVFALLLLPTLLAALQPLGLDALTQPLSRLLDTLVSLVPRLFSAVLIVGIAVLIGRALANLVTAMLAGAGLDRLPERLAGDGGAGSGTVPAKAPAFRIAGRTLSECAGAAVMVGLVIVAVAQATEILGLPVLSDLVATIGAALGRLAVAAVVLVAGVMLSLLGARSIESAGWPHARGARLLALTARGAILFFTAALALRQAGLPAEIVAIAFGAVVGAVAIAAAVAFGIGGREVAARAIGRFAANFDGAAERNATAGDSTTTPTPRP